MPYQEPSRCDLQLSTSLSLATPRRRARRPLFDTDPDAWGRGVLAEMHALDDLADRNKTRRWW